jgi:hypothetical protein
MRSNPERLAWVVLLASFFTCIGLVVAMPLGVRHYILHASTAQNVTLEVKQGPLRVTLAGRGQPVAIDEERGDIPERTVVATDATSGRLVMHTPEEDQAVVATAQLYDNTEIVLLTARSPRFESSRQPHRVVLEVRAGRVRIGAVDQEEGHPTVVEVRTPHGEATLTEGSYEIKVNGTVTEATVRKGKAGVTSDGVDAMSLGPAQRAIIDSEINDGRILGPLPAARDLIVNSDFEADLDNGWTSYNVEKEEPPATVSIITEEGRKAASFYRNGGNHAEVGIRQEINYDVRDFTSLELHLAVQVVDENITGYGGCGTLSSECPIIVLIEYKDIHGNDQEWRHGFYIGEPAPDWLLYPWTEQLPQGKWQTYDSGNLIEELSDNPPAIIKRLTIYASGHSFHAMVTEVDLLAQE